MLQVSVIIPAYNAERWLPETLQSVAAQAVESLEIILIDDGSTDGTANYVRENWPHIQLVSTENLGVSHARNLGTALAKGEFIQYLDADDLLLPGKVARQLALFAAHPEVDVIYSNWQRLLSCADGSFAPGEKIERRIEDVHPDREIAFFSGLWCPTGAYLYRRAFLDKVLPWKEWLPVIQDARFALDCAMAGACWLHDPAISVLYRQHQTGSVSTRSQLAFLCDCVKSTDDIRRLWSERGCLDGQRRHVLLDTYQSYGSTLFELDRLLFDHVHAQLRLLEPNFKPNGTARALLTCCLGYPAAEQVAAWWRGLKRWLLPSAKRPPNPERQH